MKTKTKNTKQVDQKNMTLLAIVVLLILAFMLILKGGKINDSGPTGVRIENSGDLDTAARDLDGSNLNQIDTETTQLTSESSSF